MNRLYEKLAKQEFFNDKLKWDEAKNCLTITFNEHLRFDYLEGNYKSAKDEGYLSLDGTPNHWHIQDDDEILEIVTAFATGELICIKDTSFFSFAKFRILEKEKFQKKKAKYMARKSLRIYTGNQIIKH